MPKTTTNTRLYCQLAKKGRDPKILYKRRDGPRRGGGDDDERERGAIEGESRVQSQEEVER